MDPLNIASAVGQGAKLAWKVGNALYNLIEDTKVVDESVKALASEATQLGNVCDSVDKQLHRLADLLLDAEDAQLFSSIQMQLSECDRSMRKLSSAIETVRVHRSNALQQATRQVQIYFKEDTISESRTQIRAHTANLQISLQLVNLKATFLAPKLANQELLRQMSQLHTTIVDQGERIDSALIQCAKGYLSSGSTLYEESIAGDTETAEYSPRIAEWISGLTALRIDSSRLDDVAGSSSIRYDAFSGRGAEPQSPDDSFLPRESSGSLSNLPPEGAQQDSEIDLEEDQLALDLATAAKQNGDVAFEGLDYAKAESMFREALSLMQELPLQTRSGENLLNIHYKLAACAFYLHDQSTAESALVTVVEQPPQSTEDALDLCRAGHLLALTYTVMEKLDAARSTCNNTYKTRRRLLGKDDEQCYESLALLAYISGKQDQHTRSEIYMSTIPEVHRKRLCISIIASIRAHQKRLLEPAAPSFVTQAGKNDANQQSEYQIPFFRRAFKNLVKGHSPVQAMVRDATNKDPSGPTGAELRNIAQTTFNSYTDSYEIMSMLYERLTHKRTYWRHVYKSLKVLDYCLREGSELCVDWSRENIQTIKKLSWHRWVDSDGDILVGVLGK